MRIVSNITCIFAIIAQIFLSSIAFAHDLTCQATTQPTSTDLENSVAPVSHIHSGGCCHHDHAPVSDRGNELAGSDTTQQDPFVPSTPCSCNSDTGNDFIVGNYSIETRERKIALLPVALEYSLTLHYSITSTRTTDTSALLQPRIYTRTRDLFLSEYSGNYLSTHLSKFII